MNSVTTAQGRFHAVVPLLAVLASNGFAENGVAERLAIPIAGRTCCVSERQHTPVDPAHGQFLSAGRGSFLHAPPGGISRCDVQEATAVAF